MTVWSLDELSPHENKIKSNSPSPRYRGVCVKLETLILLILGVDEDTDKL